MSNLLERESGAPSSLGKALLVRNSIIEIGQDYYGFGFQFTSQCIKEEYNLGDYGEAYQINSLYSCYEQFLGKNH